MPSRRAGRLRAYQARGRAYRVRSYETIFILTAAGTKAEQEYFALFGQLGIRTTVQWAPPKTSDRAPERVLRTLREYLNERKAAHGSRYEAWLVVDKGRWTEDPSSPLLRWAQRGQRYGLAVSNPAFEYWLLLHFEDARNIRTARQCADRLQKYIPGYSQGLPPGSINLNQIRQAIERAERRDARPGAASPRTVGTTVYRLVKKILETGRWDGHAGRPPTSQYAETERV